MLFLLLFGIHHLLLWLCEKVAGKGGKGRKEPVPIRVNLMDFPFNPDLSGCLELKFRSKIPRIGAKRLKTTKS
jgi:hypothetical protein